MSNSNNPPSKHALQSTTIQGILVMVLSVAIPLATDLNTSESQAHARDLVDAICATSAVFSALWAARGRKDANVGIHWVKAKKVEPPSLAFTPSGTATLPRPEPQSTAAETFKDEHDASLKMSDAPTPISLKDVDLVFTKT